MNTKAIVATVAFRTGEKRTLSPERKKQLAETLKRAREQR
jgi:hypothetical protein